MRSLKVCGVLIFLLGCEGAVDGGGAADGATVPDLMARGADAAPAEDPCTNVVVTIGDLEIFAYEASRVDATSEQAGVDDGRACSRASVLPFGGVELAEASAACTASGFTLSAGARPSSRLDHARTVSRRRGSSTSRATSGSGP